jgi:hypothetical protein
VLPGPFRASRSVAGVEVAEEVAAEAAVEVAEEAAVEERMARRVGGYCSGRFAALVRRVAKPPR